MTNTAQRFIEDAIKGGWKRTEHHLEEKTYGADYNLSAVLLDPKAWEAAGKTRGWGEWTIKYGDIVNEWLNDHYKKESWKKNMTNLIPARQSGQSIEEYLSRLE